MAYGYRLNTSIAAALISVQVLHLLIVPRLLEVHAAWGWLLVIPLLLNNTLWASIHEAIHGVLLPGRHRNEQLGRTLAILHSAPFALLRMGHLLHHRYSRTERERTEVYDDSGTGWLRAAGGYYAHLFGGLYLAEVAGGLILLLPRPLVAGLAHRLGRPDNVLGPLLANLMRPEVLAQARLDAACAMRPICGCRKRCPQCCCASTCTAYTIGTPTCHGGNWPRLPGWTGRHSPQTWRARCSAI
jgi:hypothetical protein